MVAANAIEAELIAEAWPYAMRLVAVFCGRFPGFDRDAIESDALLGLCLAARKADPRRQRDRFPAYARKRIIGEILDGIRRESKQQLILAAAREFGRQLAQGNDPLATAAIRDEAEFVRANLRSHAHAHSGNRRLSATSLASQSGISVSAAARRIRLAQQLIEGSLSCAN